MACPTCKDQVTTRIDPSVRGANRPVIRVVTHLCQSCVTELKTVGAGKARTTITTHTCARRSMVAAK